MVKDLDLLQDYETASALDVDTPEDAHLVAHLDQLERGQEGAGREGSIASRRLLLGAALSLALAAPPRPARWPTMVPADAPCRRAGAAPGARERWDRLSPEQKERLRERWRAYQALPPERREELQEKLRRFRALPPERREEIRRNWESFQKLPRRDREEIRERFRRYRELSPERRAQLRRGHPRHAAGPAGRGAGAMPRQPAPLAGAVPGPARAAARGVAAATGG